MKIANSYYPSIQLLLNSKYASSYKNNEVSHCYFELPGSLPTIDGHIRMITLVNSQIPHSWYNVNSNNNTLNYSVNGITQTSITITSKNYNITELVSFLNSSTLYTVNNISCVYNSSTNKLTFTNGNNLNFIFLSTSTCFDLLGFSSVNNSSSSYVLTSTKSCDLSYTKSLYITLGNISIKSMDCRTNLNYSNVITKMCIEKQYLSIETYKNYNYISHFIYDESPITKIELYITDDNFNDIQLNNCHFDCCLIIDYLYNPNFEKTNLTELRK